MYATDRLIERRIRKALQTSSVTRSLTTPNAKLSSLEFSDTSALDQRTIHSWTDLAVSDKTNVAWFDVDAINGFKMRRDFQNNDYVIGNARDIWAPNSITVGNHFIILAK